MMLQNERERLKSKLSEQLIKAYGNIPEADLNDNGNLTRVLIFSLEHYSAYKELHNSLSKIVNDAKELDDGWGITLYTSFMWAWNDMPDKLKNEIFISLHKALKKIKKMTKRHEKHLSLALRIAMTENEEVLENLHNDTRYKSFENWLDNFIDSHGGKEIDFMFETYGAHQVFLDALNKLLPVNRAERAIK